MGLLNPGLKQLEYNRIRALVELRIPDRICVYRALIDDLSNPSSRDKQRQAHECYRLKRFSARDSHRHIFDSWIISSSPGSVKGIFA